jgi:hypothetical protein
MFKQGILHFHLALKVTNYVVSPVSGVPEQMQMNSIEMRVFRSRYSQFSLFMAFMPYKLATNTKSANAEPLCLWEIQG